MQASSNLDGDPPDLPEESGPVGGKRAADGRRDPVARRLRHFRAAVGFKNPTVFAKHIGVTVSAWSNIENGFPLSKGAAFKIVQKFPGMTLDYLWFGKTEGLTGAWLKRLEETPAED